MAHLAGWRTRLLKHLSDARGAAFAWGENDCASFAADAIEEMTGIDYREAFKTLHKDENGKLKGKHGSKLTAIAALERAGFASLPDLLASVFEEVHPSQAATGDIVAVPAEATGWTLGVCTGATVTYQGGWVGKLRGATRAFRVANPKIKIEPKRQYKAAKKMKEPGRKNGGGPE